MQQEPIILDYENKIILDPSNPPLKNYQVLKQNYFGLKILADSVRAAELEYLADNPHGENVFRIFFEANPIVPCAFSWFSMTLINYLRLVSLIDLMTKNNWKSADLAEEKNRKTIKKHCSSYIQETVPEIYIWRNKVSAHFAATDPFQDTLATIEQSVMDSIVYKFPYYYVGTAKWHTQGTESQLGEWSLTKTYENLRLRFWPDMHLKQIPNLNI